MKITFEGWARNHGNKTMLDQVVERKAVTADPFPIGRGEIKVKILTPDTDLADGVQILFSTDMRLGGDQLGRINISSKELMTMIKCVMSEKTLSQFVKSFQAA